MSDGYFEDLMSQLDQQILAKQIWLGEGKAQTFEKYHYVSGEIHGLRAAKLSAETLMSKNLDDDEIEDDLESL